MRSRGTLVAQMGAEFSTPHYFDSDLAIFKAFRVNDSQRFEIRVSATNWLNHPNSYFGGGNNADDQLIFNGLATGSQTVTNSNASTTGFPLDKNGFRWMQLVRVSLPAGW